MDLIGNTGLVRSNENFIEVLHDGSWIKVGTIKFGQFVPHFPDSVEKGLVVALQLRASAAIAGSKTRSIFGFIKHLFS